MNPEEPLQYTPENYTALTWFGLENGHHGTLPEAPPMPVEPRPNEALTQQAIDDGVYTSEEVGGSAH